jgi:hypothetical protein
VCKLTWVALQNEGIGLGRRFFLPFFIHSFFFCPLFFFYRHNLFFVCKEEPVSQSVSQSAVYMNWIYPHCHSNTPQMLDGCPHRQV